MSVDTIRHVTEYDEYKDLTSKGKCVVKFTANWCGPCRTIAPKFKELAAKYKDVFTAIEVDVDESGKLSDVEDVSSIPLILFYHDGKKLPMYIRGGDVSGLNAAVTDFVQSKGLASAVVVEDVEDDEPETITTRVVVVDAPTTGTLDMSKLTLDDGDDSSTIEDMEESESDEEVIDGDVDDIIIEKTVNV